jgi:hypothetical protein
VQGANLTGLLREVLVEPLEPASVRAAQYDRLASIPQGFDAWFAKCLERDPLLRFGDASQALEALAPVLVPGSQPHVRVLSGSSAPGTSSIPAAGAQAAFSAAPAASVGALSAPTSASIPSTKKSNALLWAILALVGLILVSVLAVGGFLLFGNTRDGKGTRRRASDAEVPEEATQTSAPDPSASGARPKDGKSSAPPTKTGDPKTPVPTAQTQPDAAAPASKRNLDTGAFNAKIVQVCWKGNEGVGPNAPHASVGITLKVGPGGGVQSVAISNAAPWPSFRACVVTRGSSYRGFPPGESTDTVTFSASL